MQSLGGPRGGMDREQGPARLRREVSDVTLHGANLRWLRSQRSIKMDGGTRGHEGGGSRKGAGRVDDGPKQGNGVGTVVVLGGVGEERWPGSESPGWVRGCLCVDAWVRVSDLPAVAAAPPAPARTSVRQDVLESVLHLRGRKEREK